MIERNTLNSTEVRSDITCVLSGGVEDYKNVKVKIHDPNLSEPLEFDMPSSKLYVSKRNEFFRFSHKGISFRADFNTDPYFLDLWVELMGDNSKVVIGNADDYDKYISFYFTEARKGA